MVIKIIKIILILISRGSSEKEESVNMETGKEVKFPSGEVKSIENCHNDVGQHHKYIVFI